MYSSIREDFFREDFLPIGFLQIGFFAERTFYREDFLQSTPDSGQRKITVSTVISSHCTGAKDRKSVNSLSGAYWQAILIIFIKTRVAKWHYGSPSLRVVERAEVFTEFRKPQFDLKNLVI